MEPKDSTENNLDRFLRFDAVPPKAVLDNLAREELGETEDLKRKCLDELKVLIREHKLNCKDTDDFLLRFLRIKKFNVKKSFQKVRQYSDKIGRLHKYLLQLKPETLENILRHNLVGIFPYRDSSYRLLCFYRTGPSDSSNCTMDDIALSEILMHVYAGDDPTSQITGLTGFVDASTSMSLYEEFRLIQWMPFTQNILYRCLPIRMKGYHVVKESTFIKYLLRCVRPIVPRKIFNRVILHGTSTDDLFKQFDPCILPYEFFGSLGPLNNDDHLIEVMKDYLKKIQDEHRDFLQDKEGQQ